MASSTPDSPDSPEPEKTSFDNTMKGMPAGISFSMPSMPSMPFQSQSFGKVNQASATDTKSAEPFKLDFDLTPRDVKRHLDRFIIGQKEAKRALAIAVCDHYNHVRLIQDGKGLSHYIKQNILLLGPTGVGKTYLIRCLADLIGVPFVKADATKFSETGYVGQDVDELVRQLVQQANGDITLAECGIIYLDEIDKLAASSHSSGRDISGRGVQTNLLKLMEETEVALRASHDMQAQLEAAFEAMQGKSGNPKTINTRSILFIASGSFPKLDEMISRRIRKGTLGFSDTGHEETSDDLISHLSTRDLIEYGFEAEFAGRLPVRVQCHPLTAQDLHKILIESEGSILKQYQLAFRGFNIDINFSPEALETISEQAVQEETGARGLMSVLEKTLRGLKYELPSTRVKKVEIDQTFMENPTAGLENYLQQARKLEQQELSAIVKEYSEAFLSEHGITLEFTSDASSEILRLAHQNDLSIKEFCDQHFKDFPYGLKLIAKHTPDKTFTIDCSTVEDPDKALSAWVVKFYNHTSEKTEST